MNKDMTVFTKNYQYRFVKERRDRQMTKKKLTKTKRMMIITVKKLSRRK